MKQPRPDFDLRTILAWADAHHARHGVWPQMYSGEIEDYPTETWRRVDNALRLGLRGLGPLGGSSLARLLAEERGVRNVQALPRLTEAQIAEWALAYKQRAHRLPTCDSGPVFEAPGEVWDNIDAALRNGDRGLPGGDSLARLLARRFRVRNKSNVPRLTVRQILAAADRYRERTGEWPTRDSGAVDGIPGDTWNANDQALEAGRRGLPGGSSLAKLLAEHCGRRNKSDLPPLTLAKIRRWAALHRKRTGRWPRVASGPVVDAPGETWKAVNQALWWGWRGLRGESSLVRSSKAIVRSGGNTASAHRDSARSAVLSLFVPNSPFS